MSGFRVRLLQPADAKTLLQFEQKNQCFFEQSIEARPDGFYQPEAIQQHIDELMALCRQQLVWPTVIFNAADELIGRANLKDIDKVSQSAYIGYRIAEHWSGKGVASFAVQQLSQQARQLGLKMLFACVSTENRASERVLDKAGFVRLETLPQVAIINSKAVDAYLMWRKL
jgi:ribosomal-protein-alanine N-acetyltransferase